jgi:phosphomevalonate kinase
VLRFLQGLAWNNVETHKLINEHNEWCNSSMPFTLTSIEALVNQGVVYTYKRDKGFRPIIIINVDRLLNSKVTI